MFKRLFFFSGIIAFLLACAVMWLWYIPRQEALKQSTVQGVAVDTLSVDTVQAMPQQ
jgi:hypothetical protein